MRRFLSTVAAAIVAGLLTITGTAAAAPPQLSSQAVFNDPGKEPYKIVEHLVEMINGANSGSRIMAADMIFDDPLVNNALVNAAKANDVYVRVVYDRVTENSKILSEQLGEVGNGSYAIDCQNDEEDGACIGTNSMHSKFFLFSETLGEGNVVSVGTANLNDESATHSYNSWYTETNNEGLHKYYGDYWTDLVRGISDPNYYQTRKPQEFEGIKSYFYPRSEGDTVVNSLKEVNCQGTDTKIRVANWSFSRTRVAESLRKLADAGCQIEVIATRFYETACKMLAGAKNVKAYGFKAGTPYVHSKSMMIEGHYTKPGQTAVWTGSHNLNNPSLTDNDETVIRIMNRPDAYADFVGNFDTMKEQAELRTQDDCEEWT